MARFSEWLRGTAPAESESHSEEPEVNHSVSSGVHPTGSSNQHGPRHELAHRQLPTTGLTAYQVLYVFVLDGIGGAVLSGGINFAIAYAMYATQDPTTRPIRLFHFPNTLAGDAAVTIILQCIITWSIEYILVNRDVARGTVAPVRFSWEPTGHLRWFFFLEDRSTRQSCPGTETGMTAFPLPTSLRLRKQPYVLVSFVVAHGTRVFAIILIVFVLTWGPCIGALTAVGRRSGNDWVFERVWAPQVFKLVLGAVLGLFTTPLFALFWLAREGWQTENEDTEPILQDGAAVTS
ncbi:hypothetical protein VTK73DRAFT_5391 [Phialemonium thermophilum]|uniref:Uncharacterized protein n=1 Tax=Phialemonium thermophilum TaxID=223376 RepID=A0ABR3XY69_9PEZI